MSGPLLEREDALTSLRDAVLDAAAGRGRVVLVSGEAGIGKSRLVAELPGLVPPGTRLMVGWCDDLATARVLGPLRDLSERVGPALATALHAGDRAAVIDALTTELTGGATPCVLVVEDVHWADEATLDVLSYLARRIDRLPVAVVLTFRDDEVRPHDPLRRLLGLAARLAPVHRIKLERLTPGAVRLLCAGSPCDPDRLFGITNGNPYFVSEVIAAGDGESVPLTIADAVQARVVALDADARAAVQTLAVVPSAVESWLLEALIPHGMAGVAAAEERGLLVFTDGRVTFRHELARRGVLRAMPASARIAAERRVLDVLVDRATVESSRIVHHARAAGDRALVLEHGPIAAREAIAAGAHRQAVDHLRAVVAAEPDLDPADEAELWQALAIESYTVDAPSDEAVKAQVRAVELLTGGDARSLGAALRWLSRICWWAGDPAAAAAAAERAREVLAEVGDPDRIAMAVSSQAQLHALAGRENEAIALCSEGLAMQGVGAGTRSHLLNNLGLALTRTRQPEGRAALEESLALALAADEPEHACRAFVNLAWVELEDLDLEAAQAHATSGLALAERTEFLMFARYLQLILAKVHFAAGRWDDVVPAAAFATDGSPPIRGAALTVIGQLGVRRGDPGAVDLLSEAWNIALATGESQRIGPAASALAEALVLVGEPDMAVGALMQARPDVRRHGTVAVRAEFEFWLARVAPESPPDPRARELEDEPYSLLSAGRWDASRQRWSGAGFSYESAFALTHSDQTDDLVTALAELDALGAEPLAKSVRSVLRRQGVARVPRGPIASTRESPNGLTQRQREVADLVIARMTNSEIADHLVVSVRTVDSHVAAILSKLGVHSRRELVARAGDFGLR